MKQLTYKNIVNIGLIIISGIFWSQVRLVRLPSNIVPTGVAIIIACFSVVNLVRYNFIEEKTEKILTERGKSRIIAFVIISVLIYFMLLPYIGYFVTTFVYMTLLYWKIGYSNKQGSFYRRIGLSMLISGGLTLFLFIVFSQIFRIRLPSGIFI